ncbi:MAG: valine--tRNA ligase [Lachnospiraceae bacterium]|jgi:valyl-tRNA synthetase|nr:valine--tRNA ligase [Lachnospiraceae bacterium]MCH4028021.1 valine--tRNA ligase [Lachnospiraceae bacterium]MCH4065865.1 valine--tRNA ligase [Lachnospiraceae bacterium]MCH4111901.1 valine--tRNA ligase [Lachnospiraceae bacterium]MCI1352300.1 valine--tRNA ligase [Lachnospiraceae bacterium]
MRKELAKTYDPKGIEDRIYKDWEDKKYFHAVVDHSKQPFTIVIPPPNITGQLHMGHALDETMQDIIIRFRRMQGYEALWQPGTDHASIATEVKVINELKKQGITKADLGREGFLKKCWEWRDVYGHRIVKQLKKLGSSCDWDRERFTMDEGCNRAVTKVFVKMHEKGWIYKGNRIVNWCPKCQTSISDAEVEYQEQKSHFWHIKYPLVEDDGSISKTRFLEFATTRPETMLGDTALAVNPDDARYKDLIGKYAWLPIVDRKIPIVGDEHADPTEGTGVVKITPAHDPNDFEVGKRHNLPVINILNDDATINENGGKYQGMDRYEAREAIVKELDSMGLLVGIEDLTHNVGTHDRCGTTVEPMVKEQWFVKMDDLIKPAIRAVQDGDIKLIPDSMKKTYFNWTDNIKDWCISRQLWWGHRIPAWYCDDCGETIVAEQAPERCPKCGSTHLHQDPDTLDTWFSSALWPFETLGWPDKTEDLKYFYPTDVLVTGYDIIFFWVIRMIFSGYEQMGERPFKTVLFHGLVRDEQGRKMSKSLGNGIDPLEVINKYGADALRLTLITGNAPGNDMRYSETKVENSRNFANKVWNASRFICMNMDEDEEADPSVLPEGLEPADKWILSKFNKTVRDVTENMEKYELGVAVQKVHDFIWDEFCDWYIEMVKPRLYSRGTEESKDSASKDVSRNAALWTLQTVLIGSLKLLHPYMPFITEEIFRTVQSKEDSIMVSSWPVWRDDFCFDREEGEVEEIKEAVRGIRNVRAEMNVAPSKKVDMFVVSDDPAIRENFTRNELFFATLGGASSVEVQADKSGIGDDAVSVVVPGAAVYIPLAELVDIGAEIERLKKEEARLEGELKRSANMLGNEKFLAKAPQAKIDEEKAKQEKYKQLMEGVKERLSALQK